VWQSCPQWLINSIFHLSVFPERAASVLLRLILGPVPLFRSSDLVMVKRALHHRRAPSTLTPPFALSSPILVEIVHALLIHLSPSLRILSSSINHQQPKLLLGSKYQLRSLTVITPSKSPQELSNKISSITIRTFPSHRATHQIHTFNHPPASV